MLLGLLTLITALSISAVAIYYSVAGLVAIFAAAAVPIIIMGGVLEIGKLVTAVWLHKYWSRATWWLKSYLSIAVIVLMFITSMGIFGFLSKAHIEQTSAAGEGVAQIEQIEKEIARQQAVIARAEQVVETTQTTGTGADQNIQAQIDREQKRIDTAYDRVQPAIQATRAQLESDKQFYLDQLPAIDEKLTQFETLSRIDTSNEEAVKQLQALVGARPDGDYGSGTARAVKAYKESLEQERTDILAKVEELKAKSQEEIARLRSRAESEIDDSNKLIGRLRSQLGTSTGEDIDAIIDEQNARIKAANTELDTLTEQKFTLEAEYRKLEAEVGPIKYIAEFVYGEQADKTLLEEAVRWVILIIIFVFDPLAVLLLIASQYTFEFNRQRKDEYLEEEDVQEDVKDDGMDRTPDTKEGSMVRSNLVETKNEDTEEGKDRLGEGSAVTEEEEVELDNDDRGPEDTDGDGLTDGKDRGSEESVPEEQATDPKQIQKALDDWDTATENETQGLVEDLVPLDKDEIVDAYLSEKKDLELLEELDPDSIARLALWEQKEQDEALKFAKTKWKESHPNQTIKFYKNLYVKGKIDQLPWEDRPTYTEVIEPPSYDQNGEQSQDTLFNKIKNNEN